MVEDIVNAHVAAVEVLLDEKKSKEFPQVIHYETKPPSKEKIKAIISREIQYMGSKVVRIIQE